MFREPGHAHTGRVVMDYVYGVYFIEDCTDMLRSKLKQRSFCPPINLNVTAKS